MEAKEAIFKRLALAGKRLDLGLLSVDEVEEVPVYGLPRLLVTPPHNLGVQPGELYSYRKGERGEDLSTEGGSENEEKL